MRAAAVCSMVLALSACSSVKEELKPAELKPIEAQYGFQQLWSTRVGDGQDERYARLAPAVIGDTVYTVDFRGEVTAVGLANGDRHWRTRVQTDIGGGVGLGAGQLLLGSLDGAVIALSSADGGELWRTELGSEILSAPTGNADVVAALTIDGRLVALDPADGSIKWTYTHPTPVLSLRGNADPLMAEDSVYVGFDNGQLLRFETATGQLRWVARVGQPQGRTEIERLVDVDTSPRLVSDALLGAGVNGRLLSVTPLTGQINWAQPLSTHADLAIAVDSIVAVDVNSHVRSFDLSAGTPGWVNDKLHRRDVQAPAIIDGVVAVVDDNGVLHGLSLATGELVARKKVGAPVVKPRVVDDKLLLLTTDGVLRAYALEALTQAD